MDIQTYEYVLSGLKEYNAQLEQNYGNTIYETPPRLDKNRQINFPLSIFQETQNNESETFNTCFERISNLSFVLEIYAKSKGKLLHQTIVRDLAQLLNTYLTSIGLRRMSFNTMIYDDGNICRGVLVYSGNLQENKRRFI